MGGASTDDQVDYKSFTLSRKFNILLCYYLTNTITFDKNILRFRQILTFVVYLIDIYILGAVMPLSTVTATQYTITDNVNGASSKL